MSRLRGYTLEIVQCLGQRAWGFRVLDLASFKLSAGLQLLLKVVNMVTKRTTILRAFRSSVQSARLKASFNCTRPPQELGFGHLKKQAATNKAT